MAKKIIVENEKELRKAFEEKGYPVLEVKKWHEDGDTYVTITRGSYERLGEASEFGRTLGVIVAQPC